MSASPSRRSLLAAFLALPVASRFRPWVRPASETIQAAAMMEFLHGIDRAADEVLRQFVDAYLLASRLPRELDG